MGKIPDETRRKLELDVKVTISNLKGDVIVADSERFMKFSKETVMGTVGSVEHP